MSGNGQPCPLTGRTILQMDDTTHTDDAARYRALCSHDARFDGKFFVGVTSTGIYCRPVCRVRTPRRENCRFFEHAAQAERAGFRPCLRCRPELAPADRHWSGEDARDILVRQALQLLDDPQTWQRTEGEGTTVGWMADRLGVSDRHLRRIFEARLGVSPLQYLQTRRLLSAKQLLADTGLPVAQVALASGFSSLRRFNAALQERYGLSPTRLRQHQGLSTVRTSTRKDAGVRLSWRPPYDVAAMLAFLAARQLPGIECVHPEPPGLVRTLRLDIAGRQYSGWLQVGFATDAHQLRLWVSDSLQAVLTHVVWRIRALFDLDADPEAINAVLHPAFPQGDGLRVPGCPDGFELAVRAVLGQQVTVAAARTLAGRLLDRFGDPIETPVPTLNRLFPTAQTLADADTPSLAALGIVRQRATAIRALARAVADGQLDLSGHADPALTTRGLLALPGIGPWTTHYIAMRALRWPDAWPAGDVAVHQALGLLPNRGPAAQREASRLADAWRPWRSYAVIRAWAGCHVHPIAPSVPEATP